MYKIIVALYIFVFSLILFPLYKYGDPLTYNKAYDAMVGRNIVQGWFSYIGIISSREYGHFFISWVGAQFIGRLPFVALSNAVLAYATAKVLELFKVNRAIIVFLIVTNFYMLVLYFSAERLKYAFLFFLLSLLNLKRMKKFTLYMVLSLITHVQLGFLYLCISINVLIDQFLFLLQTGRLSKWLFYILPIFLILFLFMWSYILRKFSIYVTGAGVADLVKILMFFLFSILYARNRVKAVMLFLPLLIAVLMIGGDRVNMMAYFLFLYYGFQCRRGLNVGVILSMIYFMVKGLSFIWKVIYLGNAF